MNRCARNGYLVDSTYELPTDPTALDVEHLPTIGCSRLRCLSCGATVRDAPGLAFASKNEVDAAALAALYELPELRTSPLLHATEPSFRLYLCRCARWLETSAHALAEPDPDPLTDPQLPWRCDGHPTIVLPYDINGDRITSRADLRELALRGFHGASPPRTPPAHQLRAAWLVRLHAQLAPTDTAVVDAAALSALEDADARARSLALRFLDYVPSDAALAHLLSLIENRRDLFAGVPDERVMFKTDATLEDTAWRVLAPLVAGGRARELARAEASAGRGSRAIYDALARHDSAWLLAHVEDLARAAPGRAGDLVDSFSRLPDEQQDAAHRGRVRAALIGEDEPLDQLVAACRDVAKRIKQDVPLTGSFPRTRYPLPSLRSGARLEIAVGAPPGADTQRDLELRVTAANGETAVRTLKRGSKIELVIFLDSAQVAERIVYLSKDTEGRR